MEAAGLAARLRPFHQPLVWSLDPLPGSLGQGCDEPGVGERGCALSLLVPLVWGCCRDFRPPVARQTRGPASPFRAALAPGQTFVLPLRTSPVSISLLPQKCIEMFFSGHDGLPGCTLPSRTLSLHLFVVPRCGHPVFGARRHRPGLGQPESGGERGGTSPAAAVPVPIPARPWGCPLPTTQERGRRCLPCCS